MPSAAQEILAHELPEPFRFSREDYDAMTAAGILDASDQVELIDGEIVKKMSVNPSHSSTVNTLCTGQIAVSAAQRPVPVR